jgi:hypothetical protein
MDNWTNPDSCVTVKPGFCWPLHHGGCRAFVCAERRGLAVALAPSAVAAQFENL